MASNWKNDFEKKYSEQTGQSINVERWNDIKEEYGF
jgi:hypothetical protein